ncbi:hypothetical protein K1719_024574 [Acacia pycnantha]|nr:hypothetical protein K1719_024574 [Acacia pycnantha]
MPSVATIQNRVMKTMRMEKKKKHELCVCTMVWNQASTLKEWVMYHSWLGVERWFYDNNNDDDGKIVISELNLGGYNWPFLLPIALIFFSLIIILRHYSESGVHFGSSSPNGYYHIEDAPLNESRIEISGVEDINEEEELFT